jgi:anti-anti-sigma factor
MTISTATNFSHTLRDGVLVIELRGALDSPLSLEPVSELAVANAAKNVVLVLDEIEYINSGGFGAVIRLSDAVTHAGKTLYIVGLQDRVHLVFSLIGAHSLLNVLPTLNDALAKIKTANA